MPDKPKHESTDEWLKRLGMENVPRFYVTGALPTPAMGRRDDVIPAVRSLAEALYKIHKAPIPVAYRSKTKPPSSRS